ncbi:hypothetical protein, partial [Bradyrhizobium sp. CCBAU 21362]|uniref:hypothetical protein n=1 Tax=Bradyrhizobium sp. CCBAU 21362 TaxID=1325082 RepID=UPI0023064EB8
MTEDDVARAEASVWNQEAAEFPDYLAARWQPWESVVSHPKTMLKCRSGSSTVSGKLRPSGGVVPWHNRVDFAAR